MAKLILLWCFWLANFQTTVASSPPGFETLYDRSIDGSNDDYLYEWLSIMEGFAIPNVL